MPAGYKQPKHFVFVTLAELPRSTTGKIQRHEVEAWLRSREADRALEK
jgi:fatty-acyl-CoA synthase